MTETPVWKLVITLGIPTTISMLITNIYNMADTYFVSQISTSVWLGSLPCSMTPVFSLFS